MQVSDRTVRTVLKLLSLMVLLGSIALSDYEWSISGFSWCFISLMGGVSMLISAAADDL